MTCNLVPGDRQMASVTVSNTPVLTALGGVGVAHPVPVGLTGIITVVFAYDERNSRS